MKLAYKNKLSKKEVLDGKKAKLSKSLSKDNDKAHAAKPISPLLARSGCTYLPFGKPKKSQNNTLVLVMFCH